MKEILLIGTFLSSQVGTRGVSEELAIRLQERGWVVYTTSSHRDRISRLLDMIITTWRLRNHYSVVNVEVFSGPAFIWAEIVVFCLCLLHKPYILTLHGGNLVTFSKKWTGRVRRLLDGALVVTTPSLYLQKLLASFHSEIRYLPNALDIASYNFSLRSEPRANLVWLRALHQIYQPEMAVKALALLRTSFQGINLVMIGPDKGDGTLKQIQRIAQELGIEDAVQWIGSIPKNEVPHYLNQSDIFLNTTRYESFGVSVMEAAACGLPIVTTEVGELPYLWEDEQDALLVPSGDEAAMSDAICRILIEPGLAERLSRNARAKAENYDWSRILPQWEALFESLIKLDSAQ